MNSPADLWSSFTHDPRHPENAALRAADTDRAVIHQVLTEAYADGRLDREEFDVRSDGVIAARTLGELPPLVEGLVATSTSPAVRRGSALAASSDDLAEQAVERWRGDRRDAVWRLVSVSAVVWVIWAVTTGPGSFPWPVFVSLATFLNLVQVTASRRSIVASHVRRLEKKQRKALAEQPPGDQA